jgi:hypothetical protein
MIDIFFSKLCPIFLSLKRWPLFGDIDQKWCSPCDQRHLVVEVKVTEGLDFLSARENRSSFQKMKFSNVLSAFKN